MSPLPVRSMETREDREWEDEAVERLVRAEAVEEPLAEVKVAL